MNDGGLTYRPEVFICKGDLLRMAHGEMELMHGARIDGATLRMLVEIYARYATDMEVMADAIEALEEQNIELRERLEVASACL